MIPNGSYPCQYESRLSLKDGKEVFIRPVMCTDGPLLIDLFNRMTPQSIYLRFLWRLPALPEDMIHRFTHVDYKTEFALVAVVEEEGKKAVIAVARYSFERDENTTDLAVAVRDDWQGRGLGKPMLAKLVEIGKEQGISRFSSMMDPKNEAIKKVLYGLGYEVRFSARSGFLQVEVIV